MAFVEYQKLFTNDAQTKLTIIWLKMKDFDMQLQ